MKIYAINGRELCSAHYSGVERYQFEVLKRLDELIRKEFDFELHLCIPRGCLKLDYNFKNIKIVELNHELLGWNLGSIRKYIKNNDAIFVGMANNLLFYKNSIVCLHDIRPLVTKKYDNLRMKALSFITINLIKKNAKLIYTVSETSKREILAYMKIKDHNVIVASPGYEHIKEINPDYSIFDEYEILKSNDYFISIGSLQNHKNYRWIIENAKLNLDKLYVVIGKKSNFEINRLNGNILYLEEINDKKMVALIIKSVGFVQPSLYEGFGLPPLEAFYLKKQIYVSNLPVFREIYFDNANYFDPNEFRYYFNEEAKNDKYTQILNNHSWEKSAIIWLNGFKKYE